MEKPGLNRTMKRPIPNKANADLNARESHAANPPNVPIMGPMLLSVKKKIPPVFGMAVVNSAFERIVGIIKMLAMAYATMTEAPVFA